MQGRAAPRPCARSSTVRAARVPCRAPGGLERRLRAGRLAVRARSARAERRPPTAAAAGAPQSGSITTVGPSPPQAAARSPSSGTSSSAPSSRARSSFSRSRPAATTRAAPFSLRALHRDPAGRSACAEDEHAVFRPDASALDRRPADDPCDSQGDRGRVVDVLLDRDEPLARNGGPLGERPVASDPEAVREDVDAVAVVRPSRRPRNRARTAAVDARRRSDRPRRRDRAGSARPPAPRRSPGSAASGSGDVGELRGASELEDLRRAQLHLGCERLVERVVHREMAVEPGDLQRAARLEPRRRRAGTRGGSPAACAPRSGRRGPSSR